MLKVVLDKRIKRNLALQDVPAVVSRVDLASEKVNVLCPNKLSHFLYKKLGRPTGAFCATPSVPIAPPRVESSKGPHWVNRVHWHTKENKQITISCLFFWPMEKVASDGPK